MKPLMRSTLCNRFLRRNKVNTCSIKEQSDEGSFSWGGCECCENGLGTTVYECIGYSPKYKEVLELGDICGECLQYFYNGDDSQMEKAQ